MNGFFQIAGSAVVHAMQVISWAVAGFFSRPASSPTQLPASHICTAPAMDVLFVLAGF